MSKAILCKARKESDDRIEQPIRHTPFSRNTLTAEYTDPKPNPLAKHSTFHRTRSNLKHATHSTITTDHTFHHYTNHHHNITPIHTKGTPYHTIQTPFARHWKPQHNNPLSSPHYITSTCPFKFPSNNEERTARNSEKLELLNRPLVSTITFTAVPI